MKPLSKHIGEDLILIQPSFLKREYEFRSPNEMLAKMFFPKWYSQMAIVEIFDQKYELFRPSFWKTDIAIRKYSYDLTFAILKSSNFFRTKGEIDLQNGKKVLLKFGSFRKSCQVFSESQELLLTFQNKLSIKDKNTITIEKSSALIDENPWIIMMIWYLILENKRRGAAG